MVNSPSPFAEARRIAGSAEALPPVRRSLAASIGCVLSEPITAQLNIPHAASSAMDGWAVTPADHPQWRLRSNGAQRPGVVLKPLAAGEAVEVVTGSPVPAGTYSVLRTEHGHIEHSAVHGQQLRADPGTPDLEQGRNIRPEACEAQAGQLLCEPSQVLTPARAATAAVAGYDRLAVTPPPRVRLVLTGGEVITSGVPAPGQVRDVFGLALPAMVSAMGAEIEDVRRTDDDAAALIELIDSAPAEVIITTGGTAGSPADVLRPALTHLGAEILIDSVSMRPGHPALLARQGSTFVLGLPGNPLAGFAALAVLGDPLIRALRGVTPAVNSRTVMAGSALQGPRAGVRLLPAQIREETVEPLPHTNAHMMRGLADAEVFAVVPAGGLAPGEAVECLEVPGVSNLAVGWPRSSEDHSSGVS
ncbi:molybdopterin molybdotransferase MoeA [Nesterenkonia natronophila]|uniref:Molybdopterin molybdenumtransferase n=1 Tax=Nesterenkonia natronophila TaxID=2174932 RepID=A0A3A4F1D1_9MICC|nr:molybdopterin molybdotransferase MoeA [Nesterenkonia natronophila]RJN31646.1 molybdopterin molybdenumtransferase MoeA [Nesterenkonia natronophila]